jgi:DNA-binding MarR family transcriptional regulator
MTEFVLKELPSQEALGTMAERYPEFEVSSVEAHLMLLHVSSSIMNAATSRMHRHGITPSRFMVLMILNLDQETGQNPSHLSERTGVTRATMTSLITGLEQDGYVERVHEKSDRREVLIHLTQKGIEFINRIIPGHFTCIAGLMSNLTERERKQLVKLLVKVQSGIGIFQHDDTYNIEKN